VLRGLKTGGRFTAPTTHLLQVPVRKSFLIDLPFAITTMGTQILSLSPNLAVLVLAIKKHNRTSGKMQEIFWAAIKFLGGVVNPLQSSN